MRFSYTIIYVADVEKTLEFYQQAFCLQPHFLHDCKQYAELDTGDVKLAFASNAMADANDVTIRVNSIDKTAAGFEIAFSCENVSAAYQHALANGAVAVHEPVTKSWGQQVAYVRDLNGILVELCTPV